MWRQTWGCGAWESPRVRRTFEDRKLWLLVPNLHLPRIFPSLSRTLTRHLNLPSTKLPLHSPPFPLQSPHLPCLQSPPSPSCLPCLQLPSPFMRRLPCLPISLQRPSTPRGIISHPPFHHRLPWRPLMRRHRDNSLTTSLGIPPSILRHLRSLRLPTLLRTLLRPSSPWPAMPGEGTEPATLPKPTCPAPVEPPQKTPCTCTRRCWCNVGSYSIAGQRSADWRNGTSRRYIGSSWNRCYRHSWHTPASRTTYAWPSPIGPKGEHVNEPGCIYETQSIHGIGWGWEVPSHAEALQWQQPGHCFIYIYIFIIIIYSKYCLYVCEGRYFVNTYSLIPCS